LVEEVVGADLNLRAFVEKNWKFGADKIVEMWFERK